MQPRCYFRKTGGGTLVPGFSDSANGAWASTPLDGS